MGWMYQNGTRVLTPHVHAAISCVESVASLNVRSVGRIAEYKCQIIDFFENGIIMEFRGSEILDLPALLKIRLGATPAHLADDLLSERLTIRKI